MLSVKRFMSSITDTLCGLAITIPTAQVGSAARASLGVISRISHSIIPTRGSEIVQLLDPLTYIPPLYIIIFVYCSDFIEKSVVFDAITSLEWILEFFRVQGFLKHFPFASQH